MISFQNVSRTYYLDDASSITPVRGINFTVERGEFVLILGRSGSGKTSLLNLAAGLIKPTSGKIFVKGTDIWSLSDKQLSSLRARTIRMRLPVSQPYSRFERAGKHRFTDLL